MKTMAYKPHVDIPKPSTKVTQEWIWPRLSKFLRSGDLVITETGTSQMGFTATALPENMITWSQPVFGSIGYATGAFVGGTVAHQEKGGKRAILITGDGSLQLTIQGFADLLRHNTNPIV
jgi:pyruvate decarboxylase